MALMSLSPLVRVRRGVPAATTGRRQVRARRIARLLPDELQWKYCRYNLPGHSCSTSSSVPLVCVTAFKPLDGAVEIALKLTHFTSPIGFEFTLCFLYGLPV